MINWKVFWILLVASVFGVLCIIPYTLSMLSVQSGLLEGLPVPLHVLLTLQMFQNVVLSAIFIFVGLYLAGKVGLGAPLLEEWSRGGEVKSAFKAILGISMLLGVLAVILTTALDFSFYFMFPNEPIYTVKLPRPPAWQGFLASFYGAINEEILSRLFLMSLFVWIFFKIKKKGGEARRADNLASYRSNSHNFRLTPPSINSHPNPNHALHNRSCHNIKWHCRNNLRMALLEERAGISNNITLHRRHYNTRNPSTTNLKS